MVTPGKGISGTARGAGASSWRLQAAVRNRGESSVAAVGKRREQGGGQVHFTEAS